jgi:hypothetical protein
MWGYRLFQDTLRQGFPLLSTSESRIATIAINANTKPYSGVVVFFFIIVAFHALRAKLFFCVQNKHSI